MSNIDLVEIVVIITNYATILTAYSVENRIYDLCTVLWAGETISDLFAGSTKHEKNLLLKEY